jgi:hypothetical protein
MKDMIDMPDKVDMPDKDIMGVQPPASMGIQSPASNPLRLDVIGGETYMPFAKKKLRQLKRLMNERGQTVGNTRILVPDADSGDKVVVFVQSGPGMDLIRIRGGKKKLFIFLVFAPHVSDAYEVDGLNYKILAFKLSIEDKTVNGLETLGRDFKAVETLNGSASLVVQSSPDGKKHYALMPHNFSISPWLDELTPDATDNYVWESSKNQFMGRYYIGSNMAYRPNANGKGYFKGEYRTDLPPGGYVLDNCARARNTFRTVDEAAGGKKTKKTFYDFDIESIIVGQVIVYAMMGDVRYRMLRKNYIRYRETLDGPFIRGLFVGADEYSGEYGKDGFSYKYHVPVAVLDKDKALVRTYGYKITVETKQEMVTVTDNLVRSTFQIDPESGQTVCISKITEVTHRDFYVTVSRQGSTINEDLKIGDTTLETLNKNIITDDGPGFTADLYGNKTGWVVDSTKTEYPGKFIPEAYLGYGLYDRSGSSVSGYYSGSFPITGKAPARDGWTNVIPGVYQPIWGSFAAYKSFKTSTTGAGGINVMMYDNFDGDDLWIVFYKTEAYADEGEYTGRAIDGVYGLYKTSTTATYHMAYRVKDDKGEKTVVKKILAVSNVSGGGKYVLGGYANLSIVTQPDPDLTRISGELAGAVSCQIGQGIIAYTYNVYEAERGRFKRRVIGIIDIDRKGLAPGSVFETDVQDDDPRLEDFKHDHLAALGVGAE